MIDRRELIRRRQMQMAKFLYEYPIEFWTMDYDIPYPIIVAINTLNHLFIAAVTYNIIKRCYSLGFRRTAFHATLCSIGLFLLMSEGMMVRYKGNALYYAFSEVQNLVHGLLQITGGAFILVGVYHKYQSKQRHFSTNHGKWGLYACIFCCINILCGFCTLLVPIHHSAMRTFHGVWGLITYIVCMWAQFTSYETGFFHRNFYNKGTYKLVTFVILFLSAFGPTKIALRRLFKNE